MRILAGAHTCGAAKSLSGRVVPQIVTPGMLVRWASDKTFIRSWAAFSLFTFRATYVTVER